MLYIESEFLACYVSASLFVKISWHIKIIICKHTARRTETVLTVHNYDYSHKCVSDYGKFVKQHKNFSELSTVNYIATTVTAASAAVATVRRSRSTLHFVIALVLLVF